MKIDKVTITGADEKIMYNDLLNLQDDFPFVEWGILFSESKAGSSRYPSAEHRKKQFIGELSLSAHFCGWWARQVLENRNYKLITELPEQYTRIQLNYNFNTSKNFDLGSLIEFVVDNPERRIIIQYNRSNEPVISRWMKQHDVPSRIHFLYDSSGGRGTVINRLDPPIGGHYTGYAGGLNIENIDSICCDIARSMDNSMVWIDLESGARINDQFDLELVRMILEKSTYHI